jgi:nucleotide-binding universal stress UspA family protein
MKTILVPTDFSDHALYATKVAASIAKKIKAKMDIIHVNKMSTVGFEHYHYLEKYYQEVKTETQEQMKELSQMDFLKGIKVENRIINDMLMWELVTSEEFKNVDLIVMGSHGKSGFSKAFIGSNTEKIVRMAESPVLTIKNEIETFVIKDLVFASNFLEESYEAFKKIHFFADVYKAHIHLLKVITPREFEPTPITLQLMKKFIARFNLKNYSTHIFNSPDIEKGIIDFGNEINASLIAIETHGRTGFSHLINGSLAEDVVKHDPKPVLSIKIPELAMGSSSYWNASYGFKNWGSE